MKKHGTGKTSMAQESHNAFQGFVRGKVQGVGFRVFARQAALRHGIRGWVRNLDSGDVEVYAEGEEMALTEFLTELYKGPVLSHVKRIDIEWKSCEPTSTTFEILR